MSRPPAHRRDESAGVLDALADEAYTHSPGLIQQVVAWFIHLQVAISRVPSSCYPGLSFRNRVVQDGLLCPLIAC